MHARIDVKYTSERIGSRAIGQLLYLGRRRPAQSPLAGINSRSHPQVGIERQEGNRSSRRRLTLPKPTAHDGAARYVAQRNASAGKHRATDSTPRAAGLEGIRAAYFKPLASSSISLSSPSSTPPTCFDRCSGVVSTPLRASLLLQPLQPRSPLPRPRPLPHLPDRPTPAQSSTARHRSPSPSPLLVSLSRWPTAAACWTA